MSSVIEAWTASPHPSGEEVVGTLTERLSTPLYTVTPSDAKLLGKSSAIIEYDLMRRRVSVNNAIKTLGQIADMHNGYYIVSSRERLPDALEIGRRMTRELGLPPLFLALLVTVDEHNVLPSMAEAFPGPGGAILVPLLRLTSQTELNTAQLKAVVDTLRKVSRIQGVDLCESPIGIYAVNSSLLSKTLRKVYLMLLSVLRSSLNCSPVTYVYGSREATLGERVSGAHDVSQFLLGAGIVGPARYVMAGDSRSDKRKATIRVFDDSRLVYYPIVYDRQSGAIDKSCLEALGSEHLSTMLGIDASSLLRLGVNPYRDLIRARNLSKKIGFVERLRQTTVDPCSEICAYANMWHGMGLRRDVASLLEAGSELRGCACRGALDSYLARRLA